MQLVITMSRRYGTGASVIAKELSGKFVGAEIEINESDSFSDFYAENLEIKTFNGVI